MSTFVASTPLDMETLTDLAILHAGSTTWTSTPVMFTATSGDGSVKIEGGGTSFLPFPGPPTSGNLDSLTISYETPSEHLAYSLNGIGLTLQGVIGLISLSATFALATILDGDDLIIGSNGADTLHGYGGNDTIYGGVGNDLIFGDSGDDHLLGGVGYDSLNGGTNNDVLNGGTGENYLDGNDGDDRFEGLGVGLNVVDGGTGNDTASFANATKSVVARLHGTYASDYTIAGFKEGILVNVENIEGGRAADRLTGDFHANVLIGNGGNDVLNGGGGADRLLGGNGKDTLTGGPGADHFVFSTALSAATNVDTIIGFSVAADTIELAHAYFTGVGAAGTTLAAAAFHKGAHAHDASDRIVYDPATGALYHDSNGNAPGGEVKFATLAHNLALTHADFLIV